MVTSWPAAATRGGRARAEKLTPLVGGEAGRGGVAAVLAHHGHVVAGGDQVAEQVLRVDAHPADGGEEAAGAEQDPHGAPPARRPSRDRGTTAAAARPS